MSAEQILIWIVIGGIAGILAEALVGGLRSGLIGAIVSSVAGCLAYWESTPGRVSWRRSSRR
jgi:uncharacterized membrane protein YeaQ/YmgE (transglycosylase-associated protein family)